MQYRIEIPAVSQAAEDLSERLERFAVRYRRTLEAGHGICLTDNALGKLAFQGHELIEHLELPVLSGRIMAHVNTFHTQKELHEMIDSYVRLGVDELLVVSGDGSARQSRLKPIDVNAPDVMTVTSVELLAYLRSIYGSSFRYGVVFNPYEPSEHEQKKLKRKLAVGAEFIITQPVLEPTPILDELSRIPNVPLYIEAWMSSNISLLSQCVGYELPTQDAFDPMETLRRLRLAYPQSDLYLALLNFKTQFDQLVSR